MNNSPVLSTILRVIFDKKNRGRAKKRFMFIKMNIINGIEYK